MLSLFPALEKLTRIASCHHSVQKSKSLVICEESLQELCDMFHKMKWGFALRSLHLEHMEFRKDRTTNEWGITAQTNYACRLESDGQTSIRKWKKLLNRKDHFEEEDNLKLEIQRGVYSSRDERKAAEYPLKRLARNCDLVWLAQMLGLEWALAEMVPEGLLSRDKLLNSRVYRAAFDARAVFQKHQKGELDGRATLKKELRARKWVEKYGRHALLYDILYPATSQPKNSNDAGK
ncbi:MAG: hypothetical protein Q9160_008819 [Pyrenula sp. 1 TL-2023]